MQQANISTKTREVDIMLFKCSVCGYIHEGPEAPEKCPKCGAISEFDDDRYEELNPQDN